MLLAKSLEWAFMVRHTLGQSAEAVRLMEASALELSQEGSGITTL